MRKFLIGMCIIIPTFFVMCFLLGFLGVIKSEETTNTKDQSTEIKNDKNENTTEKKTETDSNQNETNKIESDYDIEISVKELANAYYNNELDGNKRFFGKRIKTKANFEKVEDGTFTGLSAYFTNAESKYNIYCSDFEKETKSQLSTFNRGESLNVIGTMNVLSGKTLMFKNCKIYK